MKTINKPMTTKQAYNKIYSASRGGGLLELLLVVDEVEKKSDHFTSRKIVGCIDRMRNENRPLIEFDLEMRLRCYKHQKSKENQK